MNFSPISSKNIFESYFVQSLLRPTQTQIHFLCRAPLWRRQFIAMEGRLRHRQPWTDFAKVGYLPVVLLVYSAGLGKTCMLCLERIVKKLSKIGKWLKKKIIAKVKFTR